MNGNSSPNQVGCHRSELAICVPASSCSRPAYFEVVNYGYEQSEDCLRFRRLNLPAGDPPETQFLIKIGRIALLVGSPQIETHNTTTPVSRNGAHHKGRAARRQRRGQPIRVQWWRARESGTDRKRSLARQTSRARGPAEVHIGDRAKIIE